MVLNHTQIFVLALLVDPTCELIFLTYNMFTIDEIQAMTTKAQWLNIYLVNLLKEVYTRVGAEWLYVESTINMAN